MFESILSFMDKFGPEILVIQFGFLVILSTIFLWLWFYNRRKYHNLKHAIPANVVKNYLDCIIQNSTALKSQLFRGGGLDVGNVPSVMPLQNLMGGEGVAVNGAPSTALLEELNQKKAQIAAMEGQLSSSQMSHRDLEGKLNQSQGNLSSAEQKIKELENLLSQRRDEGGGDAALKNELNMISKERDEFRDRLKEFEIIADDLANLKRLQQENEQLKRSLSAQGGQIAAAPVIEEPKIEAVAEASLPEEPETSSLENEISNSDLESLLSNDNPAEKAASAPEENEQKPKSEKTPEDLLSEFEKMLG